MGANNSLEDLDLCDSESESEFQETTHQDTESKDTYGTPYSHPSDHKHRELTTPSSLDEVESRLKVPKLKYNNSNPNLKNAVKLYLYVGGHTAKSKWVVSEKLLSYAFVKAGQSSDEEDDDDYENEGSNPNSWWVLKIGSKVRAKVDENLQLKGFKEQRRVDFVANGVWAIKFFSPEEWDDFTKKYQDCLFENTHGYEVNDENKHKVYGKEFKGGC